MSPLGTALLALALGAGACGTSATTRTDAGADAAEPPPLGGARPLPYLRTPEGWDRRTPLPLVLVIHGYGVGGLAQAVYFGMQRLVDEEQFVLAAPDGTLDGSGKRFWNATDTCCDFGGRGVDDVAYLSGLVAEISARYPIDAKRVYVMGHSNGGAMAMRLACDRTTLFAAALELAGPFWSDPQASCNPAAPIALRVVHGTGDTVVPYDGGPLGVGSATSSPGARAVAAFFATKNGCMPTPDESAPALDLEDTLAGPETKVTRFAGCPGGADVELWSIEGGAHIPSLQPDFAARAWAFFAAHTR